MDRDESKVTIRDPFFGTRTNGKVRPEHKSIAKQDAANLAIGSSFSSIGLIVIRTLLTSWRFFEIDPDAARTPSMESPNLELAKDGGNLPVILKTLEEEEHAEIKYSIERRMRNIVPGFRSWQTLRLPIEGKHGFEINESKSEATYSPRAVSAGTIRILTILVIAEWAIRGTQLIAIEEPEIGLHPHITEQIAEVLIEASQQTQIFVSTHNPDFLDFVEPESIILCEEREDETILRRASDIEELATFRKHFSLGDIWTQGVLGATP